MSATALEPVAHSYGNWYGPSEHVALWAMIEQGAYPAVHCSTPPNVTSDLLSRLVDAGVPLVTADKPWYPGARAARRMAQRLADSPVGCRHFDHYAEKSVVRWLAETGLHGIFEGRPIRQIIGRLWEAKFPTSPAQAVGVLRDTAIHLVSVTKRLFPDGRLQVVGAHAARHADCPFRAESFVAVSLLACAADVEFPMQLSAAKCVRPDQAGKELLIGFGTQTLQIDFATDVADLIGSDGMPQRLFPHDGAVVEDPYERLVRKLAAQDPTIGFSIEEAIEILTVLDAAAARVQHPIPLLSPAEYAAFCDRCRVRT